MIERRAAVALAIALLFPVAGARAGDREQAAVEMDRANAHLERREYDAAIASFNAARALAPSSSGPYLGLGLAYAATDRCREAVAYLEEYLRRAKSAKPEGAAALADCRARLVPPARLTVTSDPGGAEVRFDSESAPVAGVTPFETTDLARGGHRVFLTRAGFRPHAAEVKIEPGTSAVVTVALEPLAPPPPLLVEEPVRPPPPEPRAPPAPPRPAPAAPTAGELRIDAGNPAASIYLNSQAMAGGGRLRLRLPPGLYAVAVVCDGYRGSEGAVPLVAGERKAFTAPVRRLKTHGWLSLGVVFTFFAVLAEGTALGAHFGGQGASVDPGTRDLLASIELYGHVTAAATATLAILGYVLEGVTNRGRVDPGDPYPLEPAPWPADSRR